MGAGDLRGHLRIVVGHVGGWVVEPMLQLDVHAGAELLDIEERTRPFDPDLLADTARFLDCKTPASAIHNLLARDGHTFRFTSPSS